VAVRHYEDVYKIVYLTSDDEKITKWIDTELRPTGAKILFTNGCFDLFHIGHADCFYRIKQTYPFSFIIVGLNSDQSVSRLKGPTRPLYSQEPRMAMLMCQLFVGAVIIFEGDTPEELIKVIKPDVLFKGGDYVKDDIIGADFVKSYGGEVKIFPLLEGMSTTGEIVRIGRTFLKENFGEDCLLIKSS